MKLVRDTIGISDDLIDDQFKNQCFVKFLNESKLEKKKKIMEKIPKKYGKELYILLNKDGLFFCKKCEYKDFFKSIYTNDLINAKMINKQNIIINIKTNTYDNCIILYFENEDNTKSFLKCFKINEINRLENIEIKKFNYFSEVEKRINIRKEETDFNFDYFEKDLNVVCNIEKSKKSMINKSIKNNLNAEFSTIIKKKF